MKLPSSDAPRFNKSVFSEGEYLFMCSGYEVSRDKTVLRLSLTVIEPSSLCGKVFQDGIAENTKAWKFPQMCDGFGVYPTADDHEVEDVVKRFIGKTTKARLVARRDGKNFPPNAKYIKAQGQQPSQPPCAANSAAPGSAAVEQALPGAVKEPLSPKAPF